MLPQEHPDLAEVRGGAESLQGAQVFVKSLQQQKSEAPLTIPTVVVTWRGLPFSMPCSPWALLMLPRCPWPGTVGRHEGLSPAQPQHPHTWHHSPHWGSCES